MSGATLTGVWSDDVIAIANTQLGYQESQANYHVLDDGVTIKGYTRYGDWYGDLYGDWSAMFVSFCLSYADIPQSAVPQESGCSRWVQQLTQKGLYHSSGYEPKKGDLVFFDMDADGASDRVALVSGVTADGSGHVIRFDTVEGDSANRVQKSSYTVGQSILSGFASLPENPTAPQETVPETTAATVPEETTQDPTAETVPEDIVKETVGDIQALPNNTPSAEIQAEGGAGDGLQVGVQIDVEVNGTNIVKIPFTPEFTHSYTFVSKHPGNTDTYGYLYDASGTKVLTSNDDGAGNKQFKITYTLNAGTTYYFGVRYYRDGNFGTVPVALSLGNHEYVKNEDGEYACSCGVKAPSSGTCGEAAYWSLTDGVLTISGSGAMYDFTNSPPVPWTRLKSQISSVKVESGVTGIGRNAFSTLANLTNVTISDTVTNIGSYAFSGCTALNGIAIPNSVTGIGNHAFDNCGAMKDVTIPGSVTSIGDGAFSECKALTSVTIPDSVTSMGESVFKNCFGLTSAKLSSGMTSVPMSTFWACTALKDVYIPDGVTVIGSSAFYCCSSLNSIHIPASVTQIQGNAFERYRSLEDISIPDGVTSIGRYAFAWCEGITEISIPQSVTSVGGEFLYRCNDLKTIYWNAQGPVELAGQSRIYGQNLDHNDGNYHNQFTLIVGESADVFTGKYFDQLVNMGCGKVEFRSPNFITLSALKSDFTGAPLPYLPESRYYIDASGIFYRVDEASGKAYVAYVPAEVSSFSIPEFILAEDGKTHLPVVGVDTYAFLRSTLSQLSFEAPENITVLSNFAFYGAQNLASINGKTAAPDVLAVLSKAAAGEQLFTDTKISGGGVTTDSMWEKKAEIQLTISTSHGSEDKHDPLMGDDGAFLYYTGESGKTTISVSNPKSSQAPDDVVIRVYFRFDTSKGALNYTVGHHNVISTVTNNAYGMDVFETDIPNCYCLELQRPAEGDTLSIEIGSVYPSPTSGGGSATVWGGILTAVERASLGTGLLPVDNCHLLRWETVADRFPVSKAKYDRVGAEDISMSGDGKGGAYINGLYYAVRMSRENVTVEGVGKDYMVYADFEDTQTLPDGARLSEDLIAAIRNKTVYWKSSKESYWRKGAFMPDGRQILFVEDDHDHFCDYALSLNEKNELVIHWRFRQRSNYSTEIPGMYCEVKIEDGFVIVPEPEVGREYTVDNRVKATQHFTHSGDKVEEANCVATVTASAGSFSLTKRVDSYTTLLGDARVWTITAQNPGVTDYEELAVISDFLPSSMYLTAGEIAAQFTKDPDFALSIKSATLCKPGVKKTVTAIDGSTQVTTTLQNTGSNTSYSGMSDDHAKGCVIKKDAVISFAWANEKQLKVTVDGGQPILCDPTADGIQAVLDSIGYLITADCRYDMTWDHRNETGAPRPLRGGESIVRSINIAFKDTFMLLNQDQEYMIPSVPSSTNYAYAYGSSGETLKSAQDDLSLSRDFSLSKTWSQNGKTIDSETKLGQGSVLDYSLNVSHFSGYLVEPITYNALPLVDHMSGGQALLVSKELNKDMEWAAGCATVTVEDVEYYLLCNPGTYSHVWTSETQMADSVTVEKVPSGLDTVIKWYFANYSGSRTDTVSYKSMVCPAEAVPGALVYYLGNETWLNDHQSHRLYSEILGWSGVNFDFDKKIVKEVGDTAAGVTYSPVDEGETVVYRLTLTSARDNDGNYLPLTLTGNDLYDVLPGSVSSHRWKKGVNVAITYGKGIDRKNEEHWEVTDWDSDQQHIRWSSDFSMSFTGTAHIYVSLTYPSGLPWQDYAARYSAETLVNTFHVINSDRSVTHALAIPGCVRLQKGVNSSGRFNIFNNSKDIRIFMNDHEEARFHYSNRDYRSYVVEYYVSLYNGGITKLYLTELWDRLPRGFTLTDYVSINTDTPTVLNPDGSPAVERREGYTVTTKEAEDGSQLLCFTFHKPAVPTSYSVHYDERMGMYYLDPGECIVMTYICSTNDKTMTDAYALNTVSMPYFNYTGAGVSVDTGSTTLVENADKHLPNDGGCVVENNGQALNHGFTGGSSSTQWITSEVAVTRGEIKPGITKALTSATDINGKVTQNPVSVNSQDTLKWTVTVENDGVDRIEDYTLTDVMQAPYMFTGYVGYTTYTCKDTSGRREKCSSTWFTIEKTDDDNKVRITNYDVDLTLDGTPQKLSDSDGDSWIAIRRENDGTATLSIRFTDAKQAIPAGGYGELTLSTKNTTDQVVNKQFLNTCFVTPMAQIWDNTTNKGNMTELETPFAEGALPSVRNSAPVTATYGYSTSSIKYVTEVGDESNTASSGSNPNFIVLGSSGNLFRYTLSVDNSTPKAMDKLILIDSLPQPGDHTVFMENDPRFSDFKVSLAETPNFTLTVTDNKTHEPKILDPSSYSLKFSTATEFTACDWKGCSDCNESCDCNGSNDCKGSSDWNRSQNEARSIRLVIEDKDEPALKIPAGSTVTLSFTCKVDAPAEKPVDPGDIAWNSFGYHYKLVDNVAELEAAPLKVGVKIPSIPQLKKQLVDHAGQPIAAKENQTFSFLLYQGTPLADCQTAVEMEAALKASGKPFCTFDLTVLKDQSVSETIFLKSDGWEWENGKYYTLVEYAPDEDYGFRGFDVSGKTTYTFVYNKAEDKVITCQNTGLRWSVELTKTDATGAQLLPGAVFALYSPNVADGKDPPNRKIAPSIERGGATWYFKSMETTDANGKITWPNLLEESYWLLEVQAPPGYHMPTGDGWLLESKNETQGIYAISIINTTGHELPNSGGLGTHHLYTMGGALLTAAGMLLLYKKKKRGKEDPASS